MAGLPKLTAGDVLGRYEILGPLGEGGMGVVFLAEDTSLKRRVALKLLHDDVAQDRERRARFLREARLGAQLSHPHAVTVYEVGEQDGRAFIAMELVAGTSLRRMLDDAPDGLPLRTLLSVAIGCAKALSAAHAAGLVHRDFKPENVLLAEDGTVKIADFGLAKPLRDATDPESASTELNTEEGRVLGTPAYMSPEQVLGEDVDRRSDIFSFGVALYEMMTGGRPFTGASFAALVIAITRDDPTPPAEAAPGAPPALGELVLRCLEKRRDDRISSFDEVLVALEELAEGVSTPRRSTPEAVNGTSTPRAKLSHERSGEAPATPGPNRSRWIAAAAIPLIAAGVWWLTTQRERIDNAEEDAAASARASASVSAPSELPASDSKAALDAYETGMRACRQGAVVDCIEDLERAVEEDPRLANAHLILALEQLQLTPTEGREAFQQALAFQDRLTPELAAMLDGARAYVAQSTDFQKMEKAFAHAHEQFPSSALIAYWLGISRHFQNELEGALEAYRATGELDPLFSRAYWLQGQVLGNMGKQDEALVALDHCVDIAPSNLPCRMERIYLLREVGDCEAVQRDAKAMIDFEPKALRARKSLAGALLATGSGVEAARETLRLRWEHADPEEREELQLSDTLLLSLYEGRFADALVAANALSELFKTDTQLSKHASIAAAIARIHLEVDDLDAARDVANGFLAKQGAWTEHPFGEDPRLAFWWVLRETGDLSVDVFEEKRTAWLEARVEETERRGMKFSKRLWWPSTYGHLVTNERDAAIALDALTELGDEPASGLRGRTERNALLGRVYQLLGKHDEAIPRLEPALRTCFELEEPMGTMLQRRALAEAYLAAGRTDDARPLLDEILRRWGDAIPASKTAVWAKQALSKIGSSP